MNVRISKAALIKLQAHGCAVLQEEIEKLGLSLYSDNITWELVVYNEV